MMGKLDLFVQIENVSYWKYNKLMICTACVNNLFAQWHIRTLNYHNLQLNYPAATAWHGLTLLRHLFIHIAIMSLFKTDRVAFSKKAKKKNGNSMTKKNGN